MSNITSIVSGLEYSRSELLKSIEGLSQRELIETPICEDWTIKGVLAHVIGWDRRVLQTLPLILQNRVGEIPTVEREAYNRQSIATWQDKSLSEVLAEIKAVHQQILNIIASTDHVEIDLRRDRNGRIITIRSYVIDIIMDHDRKHAAEIKQWRRDLDQAIDPEAIKTMLDQGDAGFMRLLDQVDEQAAYDKNAVNGWSINDVAGHVADWGQRMLKAAEHIYDHSRPPVPPVSETTTDWNAVLAARRADKSWSETFHYLRETRRAIKDFVARLRPGDWKLRGPYPWPDDRGTLAELIVHIGEHYTAHMPDLERWVQARQASSPSGDAKPWIRWFLDQEATGLLKKEYEAALKRAGKIWHIVRVMSLNPKALQASMRLYSAVVHRSSKRLGRPEREMIAVVVSQANHCHY